MWVEVNPRQHFGHEPLGGSPQFCWMMVGSDDVGRRIPDKRYDSIYLP
jgi:hypothetical protein